MRYGSTHRNGGPPGRVLHIVPALFGHDDGVVGGAERYALELARHMAEETPTTLVSFGDRERHETVGELKIHVIGAPWYVRGQRTNPVSLSLISELRKADVVHCHQQHVLASSLAAVVGKFTGRRVFVSDLGGGGWDVSAYVSTDRWYRGHLHISEYSRMTFGQAGKPWAHVILGGVDTAKFSPDETARRDGTVLFVGRLLPHKGVNDLVSGIAPDMPLELIGQAGDPKFLEDLKALAAGKRVTFRHDCNDAELVQAYRKALCVVLPSVYKTMYGAESRVPELLGQTLLEGMACGTPAICTDVASMPEVVEDGVTGFVVPPNDGAALDQKLRWLRDHPEEARTMGEAARRRVLENFTWPQVVRRCLEVYSA
ncbi:MAG: glycosyltransferase family 4 protein [Pyrinomonadaceae bacterium]|nr:glycosyltransferase family 4 protein [Pyrinomonadaceae bacterium]